MITQQKLDIFKKYAGDMDALGRAGNPADKDAISAHDWFVIGNLLQDIRLVNKGLASAAYADRAEEELKTACADAAVVEALKGMVL